MESYLLDEYLKNIKKDKETNLLPENLKAGITCLGVEGTLEAGGTTEVPVKLFATEEEMNADTTAKEDDLALVYGSSIANATVDSQFQIAMFPEIVVLDEAVTDYIDIRYRAVDNSKMFDCMGQLDSSRFMMDCYTENGSVRVQYTSEDGITYTRTDATGNPVDFGTPIYYAYPEMWNDVIGKFIQIGSYNFGGVFKYHMNVQVPNETVAMSDVSVVNGVLSNNTTVINTEYLNSVIENFSGASVQCMKLTDRNELYLIRYGESLYQMDTEEGFRLRSPNDVGNTDPINCKLLNLDTMEMTDINLPITTEHYVHFVNGDAYMSEQMFNNVEYVFRLVYENRVVKPLSVAVYNVTNNSSSGMTKLTEVLGAFNTENKYLSAPNQLTAIPNNVYNSMFYGKNGIENGTLTENISIDFNTINEEIYTKLRYMYENLETVILTNDNYTMYKGTDAIFIPAMFDTDAVTNMNYMFQDCRSLKLLDLNNFNTNNVTSMNYMFSGCYLLTSLDLSNFNTNSVTSIALMFFNCESLVSLNLSSFDTSNVTNMNGVFRGCKSLRELDLSNFNTSEVTGMTGMFQDCTSLTKLDISGFDFTNVTSYTDVFTSVPSDCEILVKDQTTKDWVLARRSDLTNVQIKV